MPLLPPFARAIIVPGLAALFTAASSCALRPPRTLTGDAASGVINPFGPAAMSIHPLTRIDRDTAGRLWIICHIELRDSWGDTCKGGGKLSVQLYRPTAGRASGPGVQELVWDVNLSDLERNASLYDTATRTYRLPLEDAPSWIAAPDHPRDIPIARLRAVLVTTGPHGEERVLNDEFVIGG